jgi:hypothetical protein
MEMPVEHAVARAEARSERSWAVNNRYAFIGAVAVVNRCCGCGRINS